MAAKASHVIHVHGLSADTTVDQLKERFAPFGVITTVIITSSQTDGITGSIGIVPDSSSLGDRFMSDTNIVVVRIKDETNPNSGSRISRDVARTLMHSMQSRQYKHRNISDSGGQEEQETSPAKRMKPLIPNELQLVSMFVGDSEATGSVRIFQDKASYDSIWLVLKNIRYKTESGVVCVKDITHPLDNCYARNYRLHDGSVCWIILLMTGTPADAPDNARDPARKFQYVGIKCRPHPYLRTVGHKGRMRKSEETVRRVFNWMQEGAIHKFWEHQLPLSSGASSRTCSPDDC